MQLLCCFKKKKKKSTITEDFAYFKFCLFKENGLTRMFYVSNTKANKINEILKG